VQKRGQVGSVKAHGDKDSNKENNVSEDGYNGSEGNDDDDDDNDLDLENILLRQWKIQDKRVYNLLTLMGKVMKTMEWQLPFCKMT
jgi:hypothetical protein